MKFTKYFTVLYFLYSALICCAQSEIKDTKTTNQTENTFTTGEDDIISEIPL